MDPEPRRCSEQCVPGQQAQTERRAQGLPRPPPWKALCCTPRLHVPTTSPRAWVHFQTR